MVFKCPHCNKELDNTFLVRAGGKLIRAVKTPVSAENSRRNGRLGGRPKNLERPNNPDCDYQADCSWNRAVRVLYRSKTEYINVCHRHYLEEKKTLKSCPKWAELEVFKHNLKDSKNETE